VSRRVLIVDDEKGIREALKQVLEYEEIEVQTCASGHEALRVYASSTPTWCSSTSRWKGWTASKR